MLILFLFRFKWIANIFTLPEEKHTPNLSLMTSRLSAEKTLKVETVEQAGESSEHIKTE